ncbi:hypothetical protein RRG08_039407 [Elysia crispata]|uniref:Uncharacterized protein n=1 Tax=Elysia crispata TaxID=231223 RepID=A0AAE1CMJ2_9GAST|nr:hypothetical protein RRG08_004714 [Elysia crispata]KAK3784406.1 hypothetical protein RRG08_039407 [Elysia crispata]
MAPRDDGYISHLCSMLLHVLSLSSSHVFKNIPTAKHRTRSCKFQQPNAGQRAGREEKLNLYKKQEIQSYRITILRLSSLYHLDSNSQTQDKKPQERNRWLCTRSKSFKQRPNASQGGAKKKYMNQNKAKKGTDGSLQGPRDLKKQQN